MEIKWVPLLIGVIIAFLLTGIIEAVVNANINMVESLFYLILLVYAIGLLIPAIYVGYAVGGKYLNGVIHGLILGILVTIITTILGQIGLGAVFGSTTSMYKPFLLYLLSGIVIYGVLGSIGGLVGSLIKTHIK